MMIDVSFADFETQVFFGRWDLWIPSDVFRQDLARFDGKETVRRTE
jgi:hypothetical protein